ncbi:hypothetical protein IE81DRAFT_365033 [Ceraceosorus guamensis]|uniref:Zn(2)-C6 fungal-type domain-containing protein n=1 Tax=Ceraceosorus guamensis TaxID=1522189 RepID=A0A316W417_9BASI|nr:hypothetical protein IE81DRAFT_365033 [Ceraceosorus guamensis]PWN44284.1 hypothetical protein IE81DRAFT_365033 [Ceraceosorus guamensis]
MQQAPEQAGPSRSPDGPNRSASTSPSCSVGDTTNKVKMEDVADEEEESKAKSNIGPVRESKENKAERREKESKVAQPPAKAACTFCRSRKSRCNGKCPCAACIARGRIDDCIYTISRRGGKPKPKQAPSSTANSLESHLEQLFALSDLPSDVRVPGQVPQLRPFQTDMNFDGQDVAGPSAWSGNEGTMGNEELEQLLSSMSATYGAPDQQTGQYPTIAQGSMPHQGGSHSNMSWQDQPQAAAANSGLAPLFGGESAHQARGQPSATHSMPMTLAQSDEGEGAQSLLADYYRYLYRFIPVFVSPARLTPVLSGSMPASSPFLHALRALLPLLRGESSSMQQPFAVPTSGQHGLNFGSAEKHARLRGLTSWWERKATEGIDSILERLEGDEDQMTKEALTLEVCQSLCTLAIYEYGSGRALKARLKADQALGLAMSKGYHQVLSASYTGSGTPGPQIGLGAEGAAKHYFAGVEPGEIGQMKRRVWWTVWSLVMWSAYNTARTPTIRADDPRVRTDMPACRDASAWASNVRSLQALLLVQDRVLALSRLQEENLAEVETSGPGGVTLPASPANAVAGSPLSANTPASASGGPTKVIPAAFSSLPTIATKQDILQSMQEIDASLQEQIKAIEEPGADLGGAINHSRQSSGARQNASAEEVEDGLVAYLKSSAAIQLYTSSLTLHIGQAFQGASLFERKLCFLNSVNDSTDSMAACQVPMPDVFDDPSGGANLQQIGPASSSTQELYQRGPFLPRLSLDRCVHASKRLLEISRHAGKDPQPNPFGACSFVLISFVCLMQALAISGTPDGEGDTEENDDSNTPPRRPQQGQMPASYSRDLLLSGQGAAALSPAVKQDGQFNGGHHGSDLTGAAGQSVISGGSRLQRLERIWQRVREAHETLKAMSDSWAITIPMQEEVSNCLAASKALLASPFGLQSLSTTAAGPQVAGGALPEAGVSDTMDFQNNAVPSAMDAPLGFDPLLGFDDAADSPWSGISTGQ